MLFLTKNVLTPFVLYKMNNVLLKEHSPKIVSIVSSMTVLWVMLRIEEVAHKLQRSKVRPVGHLDALLLDLSHLRPVAIPHSLETLLAQHDCKESTRCYL